MEKLKALEATLGNLEKTYGKGAIMKLGDEPIEKTEFISTGSIGLDAALGIGGLPKGRVVEIYGPESSGKTTLALHVIAEAQKKGGIAAFIDAEHAFDRFYAQKLGVDIQNLLISQPDHGEQALEIADHLIGKIGQLMLPLVEPLGFDWKMGVSLLAGSAAKEIVISTMGVLHQSGTDAEPTDSLVNKIRGQRYDSGPKAGQPVMTPLVAISFIIFVLIYFPCIAVFAAIKKESGQWRWATFTAVYTTVLAWVSSFIIFQIGTLLGF